jgi:DNA polymerase-3 subunit epsilon
VTTGGDRQLLWVETRLLLDPRREIHGYLLLMREISDPMERDNGPDTIVASADVKVDSEARHAPMVLLSRPEFYDFDLFGSRTADLPPGKRSLAEIIYTAFDTETTGLRPSEGDEIISIGAVRIVNGRILREERFEQLIDPRRHVTLESTRIHGLDDAMLQGQPVIATALPAFFRFAHDTVLVGHNAAFDLRFFQIKEDHTGVKFDMPVLDTLLLSAVVHPHHEDHSMEGIARRLGVNLAGRHTALGDAIVTGELFLKLVPLLADKGIRTLQEAAEASKKAFVARVKY